MSSFKVLKEIIQPKEENIPEEIENLNPFDIEIFARELYEHSETKNREVIESSTSINAYDVAHNCIKQVVYRLNNTPVESFANKWLPIFMRSFIGSAIHEFIQSSSQFTEREISVKVPSIRFSGRADCSIGNNTIVEIKSLPYPEYKKIVKNRTPRREDYLQTLAYKIMYEDHLKEAKVQQNTRTSPPKFDYYHIDKIQYIYVAHDIISSDNESLAEALDIIKTLKKKLQSKKDPFFFISSLVMDLTTVDVSKDIEWIKNKIKAINYYLDNKLTPSNDDEFVDGKGCYFCLYKDLC